MTTDRFERRQTPSPTAVWKRSSKSGSGTNASNCIEVASTPGAIAIRDSTIAIGDYPVLTIPTTDWTALLTTVHASPANPTASPHT